MIPITIAVLRYADVAGGMAGEPEGIVLRDRMHLGLRRANASNATRGERRWIAQNLAPEPVCAAWLVMECDSPTMWSRRCSRCVCGGEPRGVISGGSGRS